MSGCSWGGDRDMGQNRISFPCELSPTPATSALFCDFPVGTQ